MSQDLYVLIFASSDPYNPGSLPNVQLFANQDDAQNAYNAAINHVFNLTYAQILQVGGTVIQATAGSPSGPV